MTQQRIITNTNNFSLIQDQRYGYIDIMCNGEHLDLRDSAGINEFRAVIESLRKELDTLERKAEEAFTGWKESVAKK